MVTKDEIAELRGSLRRVMRGLWARRRPTPELVRVVEGGRLARRHVALLAQVGGMPGLPGAWPGSVGSIGIAMVESAEMPDRRMRCCCV